MVRTKLVPKRVRIRQWPPREPHTQLKIKTLLPEQKTVQIKKKGQVIRTTTVRRKTKKCTDRWARTFLKMALAPNWENHDAATCIIINYFVDRHHTEIILKKQEYLIAETCSYCKECKNCTELKTYRKELKRFLDI